MANELQVEMIAGTVEVQVPNTAIDESRCFRDFIEKYVRDGGDQKSVREVMLKTQPK